MFRPSATMRSSTQYLFAFAAGLVLVSSTYALSLSNLNKSCLRCLCHAASNCTMDIKPKDGYIGPFWISRIYWVDAGNHTLPGDDPLRDMAYSDCVREYWCAATVITKYMLRYGRDFNQNGVTDCDDFAGIHFWGPNSSPDVVFDLSKLFWKRYVQCNKTAIEANPLL